jgi:NTP pyrophosphatase (non-canonical NTP hydrolase)
MSRLTWECGSQFALESLRTGKAVCFHVHGGNTILDWWEKDVAIRHDVVEVSRADLPKGRPVSVADVESVIRQKLLAVALARGRPGKTPLVAVSTSNASREVQTQLLVSIMAERARQDAMWGEQNHDAEKWLTILGEEFGEACKAALEGDRSALREELVQVAAVACAAMECLDRNTKRKGE